MSLTDLLAQWKSATGMLPWGVQKYFITALENVYHGKATMAYGANYAADGSPCLVNTVSNVLAVAGENRVEGDRGLPSSFGDVVMLFDRINGTYASQTGYTGERVVQHDVAYMLLSNFGPIKTVEQAAKETHDQDQKDLVEGYVERDDADLMKSWIAALQKEAPSDVEYPQTAPTSVSAESG